MGKTIQAYTRLSSRRLDPNKLLRLDLDAIYRKGGIMRLHNLFDDGEINSVVRCFISDCENYLGRELLSTADALSIASHLDRVQLEVLLRAVAEQNTLTSHVFLDHLVSVGSECDTDEIAATFGSDVSDYETTIRNLIGYSRLAADRLHRRGMSSSAILDINLKYTSIYRKLGLDISARIQTSVPDQLGAELSMTLLRVILLEEIKDLDIGSKVGENYNEEFSLAADNVFQRFEDHGQQTLLASLRALAPQASSKQQELKNG